MKRFALFALLLATLAAPLSCGWLGGSSPDGPLRLTPDDAQELVLVNAAEAAQSRTVLPAEFEASVANLGDYGDVNQLARITLPSGQVFVSGGQFDFDGIRQTLQQSNHAETALRDFELWQSADGQEARALLEDDGYFISGGSRAVAAVLRSLDRDQGLLWNDNKSEMKQALDLAGEGLLVTAADDCRLEGIANCRAAAWAFARGERRRIIEGTGILLFPDAPAAAAAAPLAERAIGNNQSLTLISIATNNQTITLKVEIDRDNFPQLEFPLPPQQ